MAPKNILVWSQIRTVCPELLVHESTLRLAWINGGTKTPLQWNLSSKRGRGEWTFTKLRYSDHTKRFFLHLSEVSPWCINNNSFSSHLLEVRSQIKEFIPWPSCGNGCPQKEDWGIHFRALPEISVVDMDWQWESFGDSFNQLFSPFFLFILLNIIHLRQVIGLNML